MADHVIHITEAEAADDFAGLLARVRAGAEIVIESGKLPVAVIHAPVPPRRSISECIALLPEDSTATIDADFAKDVEAADERVLDVQSTDDTLSVSLRDGRVITVPLVWYPRLLNATPAQRQNWKIAGGGYGIHWPDVDEDLSTEGLLRGAPAPKASVHSK